MNRITDRPNKTSAVYCGRKVLTQPTNHFCFEDYTLVLIASVPCHCLPFTFSHDMAHLSRVMRTPAFCICENKDAKLISAFVFAIPSTF